MHRARITVEGRVLSRSAGGPTSAVALSTDCDNSASRAAPPGPMYAVPDLTTSKPPWACTSGKAVRQSSARGSTAGSEMMLLPTRMFSFRSASTFPRFAVLIQIDSRQISGVLHRRGNPCAFTWHLCRRSIASFVLCLQRRVGVPPATAVPMEAGAAARLSNWEIFGRHAGSLLVEPGIPSTRHEASASIRPAVSPPSETPPVHSTAGQGTMAAPDVRSVASPVLSRASPRCRRCPIRTRRPRYRRSRLDR
jgi:hypothetical protein